MPEAAEATGEAQISKALLVNCIGRSSIGYVTSGRRGTGAVPTVVHQTPNAPCGMALQGPMSLAARLPDVPGIGTLVPRLGTDEKKCFCSLAHKRTKKEKIVINLTSWVERLYRTSRAMLYHETGCSCALGGGGWRSTSLRELNKVEYSYVHWASKAFHYRA